MAGDRELDRVQVVVAHPEVRGAVMRVSARDYSEDVHGPVIDPKFATRDGAGNLLDHLKDEVEEEKALVASKVKAWAKTVSRKSGAAAAALDDAKD